MSHYNRDGKLISMEEWVKLIGNSKYQRVELFEDERITISTVWLGLDYNFSGGTPIIFETMTFKKDNSIDDKFDQLQWRWITEEQAREGHKVLVNCYLEGLDPKLPMEAVYDNSRTEK